MDAIRVLVVEHNPSLSTLLAQAFHGESGFGVVSHASQVTHALALLLDKRYDIVVMDVLLPDMGVLDAISLVLEKSPQSKIVLLADRDEARYYQSAARYGATACIRKDHLATQLIPLVIKIAHQLPTLKVLGAGAPRPARDPITRPSEKIQKSVHTLKEKVLSNVPA